MDSGTNSGRSRRALSQSMVKKKEALEKLRSLNRAGIKNKYDSIKEEMVYDEVDEVSYANLVSKRQREDWIVDDDGSGYAEHGREIFDDDDDDDNNDDDNVQINLNKLRKEKYKVSKIDTKEDNKKTDIRQMFISLNKKSCSKASYIGKNSTTKSLNDIKIDDSNIESIVDLAFNKEDVKLLSDYSTPQPLKLKKKITNSSVSNKRKCLETSDKIQKKILNLKRKSNLFSDIDSFNFNDIEAIDSSKKFQTNFDMSLIKEEPTEMDYLNDNDNSNNDIGIDSNFYPTKTCDYKDNLNKMEEKLSDWIVSNEENFCEPPTNSKVILPKEITFEKDDENNNLIKFYWIDAFHDFNNPICSELVFLFGKIYLDHVKSFASCCLKVQNLDRRVFILPRKYFLNDPNRLVDIEDVFKEFEEQIAPQMKIKQFRSRKVTKKYCFDYVDNVPNESEYLEIVYSAKYSAISEKFLNGNSYRHIFGVNNSILENFILDLNLMGPGWLLLKNPDISDVSISWCKVELTITKPLKQVSVLPEPFPPTPPLTILSLCFKTIVQPETKTTNIVAISCLVNRKFFFDNAFNKDSIDKFDQHFCIITTIDGKNSQQLPFDFNKKMALKDYHKTRIDVMNSERELLMFFTAKFQQIDPDIIVGHDVFNFDYDILLQRFAHYKISLHWSKFGRLKCSGLPVRNKDKQLLTGRLICDIKIISRELIRATSYDLTELSAQILKKGRFEIEPNLIRNYYETSAKLIRFVEFLMKDNDLILSIAFELNCLQLFKQITNIAGNLLSRNLLGGRSDVNEYLLLHAFYSSGYIVPDKITKTNFFKQDFEKEQTNKDGGKKLSSSSSTSSYTGGLVLHPKIGYYDRFILLMDFNSLYPSIIQEYNICFTTIQTSHNIGSDCNDESKASLCIEGILPIEIRKLVDSRRQVKRLLCDLTLSSDQRDQLDIKQKALKITANSIYGCLGFTRSRFYAKHLASLVTKKGREILQSTKELVENMGFDVIYGDTDSIMILTNCLKYEEVREIGYKIQSEVNRHYKLLEIDIDAIFRCMLLLKKKKYAALSVCRAPNQSLQFQREIKGLDIIRRDWSVLAKVAGEAILDHILKPDQTSEVIVNNIHEYLKQLANKIRCNEFDLEQFIINKALTKKPEEYNEGAKSLTHVMIALRYNNSNIGKKLSAGDTVPFVICLDGTRNSATQRGYHIDEYRHQKMLQLDLRIDNDYYLSQQLLPVVSRLCDPIDGTDAGIIAEFLGIEGIVKRSNNINRSIKTNQDATNFNTAFATGEHRFDNCQPFKFNCPYECCGKEIELRHLFSIWNNNFITNNINLKQYTDEQLFNLSISKCLHCQRIFPKLDFYLELILSKQISQEINAFYEHLVICDDNVCSYRTNYRSGLTNGKHLICPKCGSGNLQPVRSEHILYQQLTFFHHLFDLEGSLARFNSLPYTGSNEQRARKKEIRQKYGELCQRLQRTVQNFLDQSSYNEIDLGFLFRKFRYNN